MKFRSKINKKAVKFLKLAICVALIVLAIPVTKAVKDIKGYGGNNNGIYLDVPEGATLKTIAKTLEEYEIITNYKLFYVYAKNRAEDFKFGGHVFTTAMSYKEICNQLCEPGTSETVKVVIPEGFELRLIAKTFEDAGLVSAEEFMEEVKKGNFDYDFLVKKDGVNYNLEGFLFPATYDFVYGTDAHGLIDRMLSAFDDVYNEKFRARAKELGMSDYEVVTLASVIEREAANASEHKKVSGVFYNRIKSGMPLQSCATVQYILKERKPVLSIADTKIDSPYNTYMYSGLPVGPIASPGESAIEAALYPEEHGYYFFVAKSDGSGHIFSKTLGEHNRAISENQ